MKKVILILCLLCNVIGAYAHNEEDKLKVVTSGRTISVVNFEEGSKIKLFEYRTDEIVLVKRRGEIDFTQLEEGEYVLVNEKGYKVLVEYKGHKINILEI